MLPHLPVAQSRRTQEYARRTTGGKAQTQTSNDPVITTRDLVTARDWGAKMGWQKHGKGPKFAGRKLAQDGREARAGCQEVGNTMT